jgi:hypothetical protein
MKRTDQMKEIAAKYADDPEAMHARADDLLCEILEHAGYKGTVEEYKKMVRWCA